MEWLKKGMGGQVRLDMEELKFYLYSSLESVISRYKNVCLACTDDLQTEDWKFSIVHLFTNVL